MKTSDILLDIEFSLPNATREPSLKNIINPHYLVIKGLKYTLVIDLEIDNDVDNGIWNDYFTSVNEFFIYDADNLRVEYAEPGLISDWIHYNILYKPVDDFKESKYEDFEYWKLHSPLVELELLGA